MPTGRLARFLLVAAAGIVAVLHSERFEIHARAVETHCTRDISLIITFRFSSIFQMRFFARGIAFLLFQSPH